MSYQFEVTVHDDGRRLDSVLRGLYPELPLGGMMKYFRKGQVRLDGKRANFRDKVRRGQFIYVPWEPPGTTGRERGGDGALHLPKINVIYQDDMIAVINKPAGLLSQPDKPGEDSVVTRALQLARDENFAPQLCHRLDRNTSGLVIVALDGRALREITAKLKDRSIDKKYLALACGKTPKEGRIDAPLAKDNEKKLVRVDPDGEPALTSYKRIDVTENLSLLEVTLHSGRTHQIRAHLNHAGFPLAGDRKYGDFSRKKELKELGAKRPMLHAWKITLPELKGELAYLSGKCFVAPLPKDLATLILDLGLNFSIQEDEQ